MCECCGGDCKLCESRVRSPKYITSIPVYQPDFSEITRQMRINADILMREISDHANKEISRTRIELGDMVTRAIWEIRDKT